VAESIRWGTGCGAAQQHPNPPRPHPQLKKIYYQKHQPLPKLPQMEAQALNTKNHTSQGLDYWTETQQCKFYCKIFVLQ